MKRFEEFIFENNDRDIRNRYSDVITELFNKHNIDINIMFDTQGYMSGVATITLFNKNWLTENIEFFKSILNFIEDMNKKAVQVFETNDKNSNKLHIHYTFDFRDLNNIDPYFKSLGAIDKFNL